MNDLLELVVDAHGGMKRWNQLSWFRADVAITGAVWALKGKAGLLDHVVLEGETKDQRLKITPFPGPDRYSTWEPTRQTIEAVDGVVLQERTDPGAAFIGHVRQTPWDDFHAAYFAGEANWNYFVAPFIFSRPDVATEEIESWKEDGQLWRSLHVTYPKAIVAHCRQQTYYFDDAGLLRRLDYSVDILGGGPAVHYPSEYREFDGIMVPTRRTVYVRNPDGSAIRESVSIGIEVNDVTFS
jgi:hypothetical protein